MKNLNIPKTLIWAAILVFIITFWFSVGSLFAQTWQNVGNGLQQKVVGTDTSYRFIKTPGTGGPFKISDSLKAKGVKQNSLDVDGTGIKYPTVDAVNSVLTHDFDFAKSYVAAYSRGNMRNSESDIVKLNDGRYLCVYSRFYNSTSDFEPSIIAGRISIDSTGKEWGNEFIVSPNIATENVLSVSLLRIDPNTIHCFFLVRNSFTDLGLYKSVSTDEGVTWSTPTEIINEGYTDVLNAVVRRVNSNRIVIPMEYVADGEVDPLVWNVCSFYSDDNGVTYTKSNVVNIANSSGETSVVHLGGDNVLFVSRTTTGFQWFSLSTDNGATLGAPYQSTLVSVDAPAQIINYSGTLIALHNPNVAEGIRNPLTISKSIDQGATWTKITDLETSSLSNIRYAYPSITLDGTDLLITYYELSGEGGMGTKFTKINVPQLLSGEKPETITASSLRITDVLLDQSVPVQPGDNVVAAISKLQSQINYLKGAKTEWAGEGEGIKLVNTAPDNIMQSLFMSWYNTNLDLVSRIGHIAADGNLYIYSVDDIRFLAPNIIQQGKSIFLDKVGIGTDNPAQAFVVSRDGNEGLEVAVDDPTNGVVTIQVYDRTAGAYKPMAFGASNFTFNSDVEITDSTKGIILKSPDGTRYRITVANGGTLTVTSL